MKFFVVFVFLLFGSFALGLDEDAVKEQRCASLEPAANLDMTWMRSVQTWYFPIFNKLMAYRVANGHLGKPVSEVTTSDLLTGSCVTCNSTFYCSGFGTHAQYHVTFEDNGHIYHMAQNEHSKFGDHVVVYTDNEDFMIGVTCWEDGEYAFAVWKSSPTPFSVSDHKLVYDKLHQLNFRDDCIVERSCLP